MGYKEHNNLTVVELESGEVLHMVTNGLSPFHIYQSK